MNKEEIRKIYYVAPLYAKQSYGEKFKLIAKTLSDLGYEVWDNISNVDHSYSTGLSDDEIRDYFTEAQKKMRHCDIFVAELSANSASIGYEVGYAVANFKPVIILRTDEFDTPLGAPFRGNSSKLLNIIEYNEKNLKSKLKRVLRRAEKGIFVKRVPIEFTKNQVEYIEYRQQIPWFKSFNATVRQLVEECLNKDTKYLAMRSSDEDSDQD